MPKLPVVSGEQVIKLLRKLGYEIIRQKGSHVRLRKITEAGEHNITVPKHPEVAKGTLNDILTKVSIWNNISKEKLIEMLGKM
ncbi:MAG: type II toxin-antitoxin system HicA family toxin [Thermoplasmata archaeon]|nr:type II toxin-antitoxin system HicA family toxin [Thermoplasmata archaeon]